METRFDAVVEAEITPGGPGAAVAVLRDGEFVHRKAYGLGNLEWAAPLVPNAVFRIASLTKQFTAMAVMILAERGALALDDPLEAHLPRWRPRGRSVTIRRLLNHTSGIRRHDTDAGPRTDRPDLTLNDVMTAILEQPFVFEPGERYSYNNSGYLLLGAVIAQASGRPYEAFLDETIFAPLGMSRTGFLSREAVTPWRAQGYVSGRRGFHNARPDPLSWSQAAGGLCSTLDDLALWERAVREHRLVSVAAFEQMLAPTRLNDGSTFPYGFGWGVAAYRGARVFHHTGGVSGFGCHMAHLRDESLTTIVLSNLSLFPFDRVTRGLLRAAKGWPEAQGDGEALSAQTAAACRGTYANGDGHIGMPLQGGAGGWRSREDSDGVSIFEARDPEVRYRFSGLDDSFWRRLDVFSPLWPTATYHHRAP